MCYYSALKELQITAKNVCKLLTNKQKKPNVSPKIIMFFNLRSRAIKTLVSTQFHQNEWKSCWAFQINSPQNSILFAQKERESKVTKRNTLFSVLTFIIFSEELDLIKTRCKNQIYGTSKKINWTSHQAKHSIFENFLWTSRKMNSLFSFLGTMGDPCFFKCFAFRFVGRKSATYWAFEMRVIFLLERWQISSLVEMLWKNFNNFGLRPFWRRPLTLIVK